MAESDSSSVVVLLDVSAAGWSSAVASEAGGKLTLKACVEAVVVFVNAVQLLDRRNHVALVAVRPDCCRFLYRTPQMAGGGLAGTVAAPAAAEVGSQVFEALRQLAGEADGPSKPETPAPPSLSGALSVAMCYLQRRRATAGGGARVLCMPAAADHPVQYIATMNAIFAAQRAGVPIDACPVGGRDSALLQQAAHLTNGLYHRPPRPDGLLQARESLGRACPQYLLTVFAADGFSRRFLALPRSTSVDFRASCFCHKRSIDQGFVCSVCLSIFCERCDKCSTCQTTFHVAKVPAKRGPNAVLAPAGA